MHYPVFAVFFLLLFASGALAQPVQLFHRVADADSELNPAQSEMLAQRMSSPERDELVIGKVDLGAFEAPALAIQMPDGHGVFLDLKDLVRRADDDYSWWGEGHRAGNFALFVVHGGSATGVIKHEGRTWRIDPLTNGLHVLSSVDVDARPQHPPGWEAFQAEARAEQAARIRETESAEWPGRRIRAQMAVAPPVVTVIAAYTQASAAEAPNIEALIQLSIDEANYTHHLSGIEHRYSLVHVYETDTSEQGAGMGINLQRYSFQHDQYAPYYPEVHTLREQYNADLAMLVGEFSDACGLAWLWADLPQWGFSVVHRNCIVGNYTVAHEFGHNLAAHHNPEQDTNTEFPYGHGSTNIFEGWRTVMAYNHPDCPDERCVSIPYWSSPNVFYQGIPTGDATLRDNVRLLNEHGNHIAGLFGTTTGPRAIASVLEINTTVQAGEEGNVQFDISNIGEAQLRWEVAVATSTFAPQNVAAHSTAAISGDNSPLGGPDTFGYTWIDPRSSAAPAFEAIDLSVIGTAIPAGNFTTSCGGGAMSNGIASVNLPFAFPFYGAEHATARVGVNGLILFGTFDGCTSNPVEIPTAAEPNNFIAPLWMDFDLGNGPGAIYTHDFGDGRFGVQWNIMRSFMAATPRIFQAILYEGGDARFQYVFPEELVVESGFYWFSTIGIESPGGTDGLLITRNIESIGMARAGVVLHVSPPVHWLTVGPGTGETAPGHAIQLTATLDASELGAGEYAATLRVLTNDPLEPVLTIPVNLTVSDDPLPVEIALFDATALADKVVLTWLTESETNNAGFEVQRALDGASFSPIGYVEGGGTTVQRRHYEFADAGLPFSDGVLHYRLKQIDLEGKSTFSAVLEVAAVRPARFALHPNHPNPFNPTTTLRFEMPESGHVRLEVFDMLGRSIALPADGLMPAGRHEIAFEASHLASGTYLYRLSTDSFTATRKMVLMK